MKQNSYPVGTIFEMAQIPEEALPRFMDELPEMLRDIRRASEIYGVLNAAGKGKFSIKMQTPVWIDDDKRQKTFGIVDGDGTRLHSVTFPINGAE